MKHPKLVQIIITYDILVRAADGTDRSRDLNADGKGPFREWLRTLTKAVGARIQLRVQRFELGKLGDHKNVGEGVWEARVTFGPGYRI